MHLQPVSGNQMLFWQTRVNSDFTPTIWAKNCRVGALIWRALHCLNVPLPPWSQCKIDLKSQKPHSGVILLFSLIPQSSMIPRWLWLEIRYGPVYAFTITYKLICAHNKSMKCWQVAALHMDNLSFQQISGGKTNNYFEGFLNGSIFSFYPPLWACMPIVRVCLIKSCRDHLLLLPWLAH